MIIFKFTLHFVPCFCFRVLTSFRSVSTLFPRFNNRFVELRLSSVTVIDCPLMNSSIFSEFSKKWRFVLYLLKFVWWNGNVGWIVLFVRRKKDRYVKKEPNIIIYLGFSYQLWPFLLLWLVYHLPMTNLVQKHSGPNLRAVLKQWNGWCGYLVYFPMILSCLPIEIQISSACSQALWSFQPDKE